ncbi:MAG: DUF2624 family protein [Bacilli bacterium]|nr:DUF2624 family protein [Bacilli bacterium]
MYKELALKYIKNLTPKNIDDYAKGKGVTLSNEEINIIFNFILQYYEDILNKNTKIFNKLKPKVSNDLYNKIISLYEENKNKYL